MKTLVVVFLFGAAFLCANASILEHIYNNTNLRGNVRLNTDDGVKLGYDGKLSFIGFDIASVGGNFKAVPKGQMLGNSTNGSIEYYGDIQLSNGKHNASVSVDGKTALWAEYDVQTKGNGGALDYNATVKNYGNWKVRAGNNSAEGDAGGAINVTGHACGDREKAYVTKRGHGGFGIRGNITGGDADGSTFKFIQFGKGGLKKKLYFNDGSHGGDVLPSVAYTGVAGGKKTQFVHWNDHRFQNSQKGGAKFGGLAWVEHSRDNDTSTWKIKGSKSADFGHKGYTIANGDLHSLYGGVGTVTKVGSAAANITGKDVSAGVFEAGDLHYAGVVVPLPKGRDNELIDTEVGVLHGKEFYDDDQESELEQLLQKSSNVEHHGGPIKTFVHAQWAGGKGVEVNHNDDNTVDVQSHGGVVWKAKGVDSKHKKPWKHHGGFGFNSTFELDANRTEVKNIKVNVDHTPKTLEELKQKYKGIDMIGHM